MLPHCGIRRSIVFWSPQVHCVLESAGRVTNPALRSGSPSPSIGWRGHSVVVTLLSAPRTGRTMVPFMLVPGECLSRDGRHLQVW